MYEFQVQCDDLWCLRHVTCVLACLTLSMLIITCLSHSNSYEDTFIQLINNKMSIIKLFVKSISKYLSEFNSLVCRSSFQLIRFLFIEEKSLNIESIGMVSLPTSDRLDQLWIHCSCFSVL